jgi:hypothetical protein
MADWFDSPEYGNLHAWTEEKLKRYDSAGNNLFQLAQKDADDVLQNMLAQAYESCNLDLPTECLLNGIKCDVFNTQLVERFCTQNNCNLVIPGSSSTFLRFAIDKNGPEMVSTLLTKGADPNLPSGDPCELPLYTALRLALYRPGSVPLLETVEALLNAPTIQINSLALSETSYINPIKTILEFQYPFDEDDLERREALKELKFKLAASIIEHPSFQPHQLVSPGETMLEFVKKHGDISLLRKLLAKPGVELNIPSSFFHHSASKTQETVVPESKEFKK